MQARRHVGYNAAMKSPVFLLLALLWPSLAMAAGQDMAQLEKLADKFVQQELAQRPASYKLGQLDRRLALPVCARPTVAWADPAVASGNTAVVIQCAEAGWTLRLPVTISEKKMGLVLTRSVTAGEVLQESDIKLVELPNPSLGRNVLGEAALAVGQTMRSGAPAGAWLRNFMVRAPFVVRANQPVKVLAGGDDFSVVAEGIAAGNAAAGEAVSVRMQSGRVVRGMVQPDGSVRVVY